ASFKSLRSATKRAPVFEKGRGRARLKIFAGVVRPESQKRRQLVLGRPPAVAHVKAGGSLAKDQALLGRAADHLAKAKPCVEIVPGAGRQFRLARERS